MFLLFFVSDERRTNASEPPSVWHHARAGIFATSISPVCAMCRSRTEDIVVEPSRTFEVATFSSTYPCFL